MTITLCTTNSPANSINKQIGGGRSLSGKLKQGTTVVNPTILIEDTNPTECNYMHISNFHRYYFITDFLNVANNIWEIHAHCDVLMSFRNSIRASMAIVEESSETGVNDYLHSDIWMTTAKDLTDVIQFPNGLLETGEYILITAGGIVS